ncbi:uncharacterized protein LOC130681364 [Manis pentadactyla]|uniref:uncharacterized protein LOC130681364 n=1 Tax=Manis pentadactyla TaxID=143292 RepID=UPI00255CDCA2|nr:uncharacterized protein LOC130681364 [Manis pentadactyla]
MGRDAMVGAGPARGGGWHLCGPGGGSSGTSRGRVLTVREPGVTARGGETPSPAAGPGQRDGGARWSLRLCERLATGACGGATCVTEARELCGRWAAGGERRSREGPEEGPLPPRPGAGSEEPSVREGRGHGEHCIHSKGGKASRPVKRSGYLTRSVRYFIPIFSVPGEISTKKSLLGTGCCYKENHRPGQDGVTYAKAPDELGISSPLVLPQSRKSPRTLR